MHLGGHQLHNLYSSATSTARHMRSFAKYSSCSRGSLCGWLRAERKAVSLRSLGRFLQVCKFVRHLPILSSIVITPHQFSEFKHASKSCLGPPDTLAKRDLTSHKIIARSSKAYQKTCNSQHDYPTPPMPFHSLLAPSSSAVPLLKPLVAASFSWRFVVGFNGVTRQGLSWIHLHRCFAESQSF
jgi:hypothetical protein